MMHQVQLAPTLGEVWLEMFTGDVQNQELTSVGG